MGGENIYKDSKAFPSPRAPLHPPYLILSLKKRKLKIFSPFSSSSLLDEPSLKKIPKSLFIPIVPGLGGGFSLSVLISIGSAQLFKCVLWRLTYEKFRGQTETRASVSPPLGSSGITGLWETLPFAHQLLNPILKAKQGLDTPPPSRLCLPFSSSPTMVFLCEARWIGNLLWDGMNAWTVRALKGLQFSSHLRCILTRMWGRYRTANTRRRRARLKQTYENISGFGEVGPRGVCKCPSHCHGVLQNGCELNEISLLGKTNTTNWTSAYTNKMAECFNPWLGQIWTFSRVLNNELKQPSVL